jgi:tetratricopeptide (TPR) repeat protein
VTLLSPSCGHRVPRLTETAIGDVLERGRLALHRGDRTSAYILFRDLIREDPTLIDAWEGAVDAVPDDQARLELDQELESRIAALGSDRNAALPLAALRAFLEPDLVRREELLYSLLEPASPASGWPRAGLGEIFRARGSPRAAIGFFEEATAQTPSCARAWRGSAECHLATGLDVEAVSAYETYLQARPRDPHALYNLASILARRRQRPRDALPYLERAAAILPEDVDILVNLGSVALMQDPPEVANAELAFTRALAVAPEDPDVHYNLGVLHADYMSRPRQAIHHFQRYLELGGEGRERVQVWIDELGRR